MFEHSAVRLSGIIFLVTVASSVAAKPDSPAPILSVVDLAAQAKTLHGRSVVVEGRIASVCPEEGCFIDVVPTAGTGPGVMVVARNVTFKFPLDCVGKNVRVYGTFINKIYPESRMRHWHKHGWRSNNSTLPEFAAVLRIEADRYELAPAAKVSVVRAEPLVAYDSHTIDIEHTDFEAARMNSGRICLEPGASTPETHTRAYHSMLFALDSAIEFHDAINPSCNARLQAGQAQYLPADSRYTVSNPGTTKACFLWVASIPEP